MGRTLSNTMMNLGLQATIDEALYQVFNQNCIFTTFSFVGILVDSRSWSSGCGFWFIKFWVLKITILINSFIGELLNLDKMWLLNY
uniref:Uncharacterized protein n=1 Tax=Heterorhabditis bacteriophora TaxID=37862 RepID=A0A1I7WGT2_HETBA